CLYEYVSQHLQPHSDCCFFFSLAPAPPGIFTSFPTRRSSDLWLSAGRPRSRRGRPRERLRVGRAVSAEVGVAALDVAGGVVDERSEEHTSELQSRENLVCRLLLEKKNSHWESI